MGGRNFVIQVVNDGNDTSVVIRGKIIGRVTVDDGVDQAPGHVRRDGRHQATGGVTVRIEGVETARRSLRGFGLNEHDRSVDLDFLRNGNGRVERLIKDL